ncbi:MAG: hypothetical protein HY231_24620 [Acidobacteria bacterium]|nr:hypothetical protein [Acidobacteriota bacterium]
MQKVEEGFGRRRKRPHAFVVSLPPCGGAGKAKAWRSLTAWRDLRDWLRQAAVAGQTAPNPRPFFTHSNLANRAALVAAGRASLVTLQSIGYIF